MLPPALLRGGRTSPAAFVSGGPLQTNMSPAAMGADPTVMQQPQPGSQANNPTMPGPTPPPVAGVSANNGQPGSGQPQLSEADYILHVLGDRLAHHSKITQKTINTLADMISAQLPDNAYENGSANAPVGGA